LANRAGHIERGLPVRRENRFPIQDVSVFAPEGRDGDYCAVDLSIETPAYSRISVVTFQLFIRGEAAGKLPTNRSHTWPNKKTTR
jgi:hypothetical protein